MNSGQGPVHFSQGPEGYVYYTGLFSGTIGRLLISGPPDEVGPNFTSGTTADAIDENSGAGRMVYDADATDPATDGGPSNPLVYSLGGTDAAAFSINAGNGQVTLTGNPNFEVKSNYSFNVTATDAAGNATTRTVTLAINNLDEVDPSFTSGTTADAIDENSGAGRMVYDADATDPATDGGPSNPLVYSLGGTDAAAFSINAGNGQVTLTGNPNFEVKSNYSFNVTATDAAGNATTRTVTLAINNLDEADPNFTSGPTAPAIDENSGAGRMVYDADATDPATDGGPSNPLVYSLGGTDAAAFSVNAGNGQVTLTGNPNFEVKSNYSFNVTATDAAGNATTRTVTLAINNLDEVDPSFTSGTTATAINENSGAGRMVYDADATDPATDGGPSNPLVYSLGGTDAAAFSINAGNGQVTLTGNPNFEVKSNYSFNVTATDAAGNATTRTVTLAINDLDEVPILTATAKDPTFTEDQVAVALFNTITASTVDIGQTFTSMTLTVTNVTNSAAEILSLDGSGIALVNGNVVQTATFGLNVTVSVVQTTARVSFSGASLNASQLQTVIDGLTYRNNSQNPTDADRIVTITELVDSGSNVSPDDNSAAPNIVSTVNVDPVNDAVNITGDKTGNVTEAGGINNGTPGTPTATGKLIATDPDNTNDTWQTVARAASIGGYGTYALTAQGAWTYTLDDINADGAEPQ